MKKSHIILGIIITLALGTGLAFLLFQANTPSSNEAKTEEARSAGNEENLPAYTNRFAPFNAPKLAQNQDETLFTSSENEDVAPNFETEKAQELYSQNNFVVIPTDEKDPFALYIDDGNTQNSLITKDIVLASYISFYKKIAFEVRNEQAANMLIELYTTILAEDDAQEETKTHILTALILFGEEIEERDEYKEAFEEATEFSNAFLLEQNIEKGPDALWQFLSEVTFKDNTDPATQDFIQTLQAKQEYQDTFLAIYDFWIYFYGSQMHPSLYDALENLPVQEEWHLFPATNEIQKQFTLFSSPNIDKREVAKPYDTLAATGNTTAQNILEQEGDIATYPDFEEAIQEATLGFSKQDSPYWEHSFHTHALHIFNTESNSTENESRNAKKLSTFLGAQNIFLQNEPQTSLEKPERNLNTSNLYLENDPYLYAYLEALTEQIATGLQQRSLISDEQTALLARATDITAQLSSNTIPDDILSELYTFYAPEYVEYNTIPIGTYAQSVSTLGNGHRIYASLLDGENTTRTEGFVFSPFFIKENLTQNEWASRVEAGEYSYPLWTKSFIGIE
jgi:hypothetical protein